MEVKIKNNEELIDATVEMVDGVMVVSPKEVKFEPKDGDWVFSGTSLIAIFKGITSKTSYSAYAALNGGDIRLSFDFWDRINLRPATKEEKNLLFRKLAEKGLYWDVEKKKVVEIKWKPKDGEAVYVPMFIIENGFGFYFEPQKQTMRHELQMYLDKDMCFKTKEECKSFCNNLNEAIEQDKP